jgi:hypothetical protein
VCLLVGNAILGQEIGTSVNWRNYVITKIAIYLYFYKDEFKATRSEASLPIARAQRFFISNWEE